MIVHTSIHWPVWERVHKHVNRLPVSIHFNHGAGLVCVETGSKEALVRVHQLVAAAAEEHRRGLRAARERAKRRLAKRQRQRRRARPYMHPTCAVEAGRRAGA